MARCKTVSVDNKGAVFMIDGKRVKIDFEECAKNFKLERGGSGRSVAERDITKHSFVFFTEPKTVITFDGLFKTRRFRELQRLITRNGYRTYDMS